MFVVGLIAFFAVIAAIVLWEMHMEREGRCKNCGSAYFVTVEREPGVFERLCHGCEWLAGKPVDKSKPLCSICRRRHGPEVTHEHE